MFIICGYSFEVIIEEQVVIIEEQVEGLSVILLIVWGTKVR